MNRLGVGNRFCSSPTQSLFLVVRRTPESPRLDIFKGLLQGKGDLLTVETNFDSLWKHKESNDIGWTLLTFLDELAKAKNELSVIKVTSFWRLRILGQRIKELND